MKKFLIIITVLSGFVSHSQDSTYVTNVQIKAGVVKIIMASAPFSPDLIKPHKKWQSGVTVQTNDNSNVTLDTVSVVFLVKVYEDILRLPSGLTEVDNFVNDFKQALVSKRGTNNYLDGLMTTIEAEYTNKINKLKQFGLTLITGN